MGANEIRNLKLNDDEIELVLMAVIDERERLKSNKNEELERKYAMLLNTLIICQRYFEEEK